MALFALGGCSRLATRPPEVSGPASDRAGLESQEYRRREIALRPLRDWRFSGRLAFSSPADSGSGHIDWEQSGQRFDIRLSAPVSRQSWRLRGDAASARLDGLEDGPREADSADELLATQFGFDVPLAALSNWLLGLAADGAVGMMAVDGRGRPLELHQRGWVIRFPDWHSRLPADLPRRVFAERKVPGGQDRVRIVVDRWQVDDDAGHGG